MKIIKVFLITILALSISVYSLSASKNKSSSNLKVNKESDKTVNTNTVESSNKKVETENKTSEKVNEKEEKVQKTEIKSTIKEQEQLKVESKVNNENTKGNRITADVVSSMKNKRDPNSFTTFDKDVEAEQVTSGIASSPVVKADDIKDNPPKPLSPLKIVTPPKEIDLAEIAPTKVYGLDAYGAPPKNTKIELLPVSYVKEISPAGKAALELSESGDLEYQKLLTAGFETPKTLSSVVSESATRVDRAATSDYMWTPMDPRNTKLWQNVEYNKYGNLLLDTHRYYTPAKFEKNQFGNIIVHAPSDSKLSITTPARNILSTQTGFLSVNESEQLVDEEDIEAFDNINENKPDLN